MKRGLVLGSLIGVAVLSMVVSGQAPPSGPTAASLAATKIEKVKENLYIITGSGAENQDAFSGGNTAVFITDSGVTLVDTMNGGSVVEQPQTLAKAVATVKNVDTIINGHIPVGTWSDLREYVQFTKEFVDYARASMKAGKSADRLARNTRSTRSSRATW